MKITIYTTNTCPYCKQLKQYLADNSVEYEDVVLDQNPDKIAEMQKFAKGFSGVPFTVITKDDGTVETVKGFDREKLESILNPKS